MDPKASEIYSQSLKMFLTYGFRSITMDEVAINQGISKKTLYQYVTNKADLVEKVIEYFTEQQKSDVNEIQKKGLNAVDELLEIYQHTCMHLQEINPHVGFELKKHYPRAWEGFLAYKNQFIYQHVIENMGKGIEEELYRNDFDQKIIATYYVARFDIFLDKDLFSPQEYSYKTILEELFKYHIRGIASNKGIEYLDKSVNLNF